MTTNLITEYVGPSGCILYRERCPHWPACTFETPGKTNTLRTAEILALHASTAHPKDA